MDSGVETNFEMGREHLSVGQLASQHRREEEGVAEGIRAIRARAAACTIRPHLKNRWSRRRLQLPVAEQPVCSVQPPPSDTRHTNTYTHPKHTHRHSPHYYSSKFRFRENYFIFLFFTFEKIIDNLDLEAFTECWMNLLISFRT